MSAKRRVDIRTTLYAIPGTGWGILRMHLGRSICRWALRGHWIIRLRSYGNSRVLSLRGRGEGVLRRRRRGLRRGEVPPIHQPRPRVPLRLGVRHARPVAQAASPQIQDEHDDPGDLEDDGDDYQSYAAVVVARAAVNVTPGPRSEESPPGDKKYETSDSQGDGPPSAYTCS